MRRRKAKSAVGRASARVNATGKGGRFGPRADRPFKAPGSSLALSASKHSRRGEIAQARASQGRELGRGRAALSLAEIRPEGQHEPTDRPEDAADHRGLAAIAAAEIGQQNAYRRRGAHGHRDADRDEELIHGSTPKTWKNLAPRK